MTLHSATPKGTKATAEVSATKEPVNKIVKIKVIQRDIASSPIAAFASFVLFLRSTLHGMVDTNGSRSDRYFVSDVQKQYSVN